MYCFFQRIRKRQAMVFIYLISTLFSWGKNQVIEGEVLSSILQANENIDLNATVVFRTRSTQSISGYRQSLMALLAAYEKRNTKLVTPKNYPKIVIKLDTIAAPGLQVSRNLIDGLLEILLTRGFSTDQVDFIAMKPENLKLSGYCHDLAGSLSYRGHVIRTPLDLEFFDSAWFHDSAMPPKEYDRAKFFLSYPLDRNKRLEEERKSYLPKIFFGDQIYWINLAVAMDDANLGVDGAAINMSLGTVSNFRRFRDDPTLGSAAATEILAIPKIWNKRLFSLIDLSRYQFAGGPLFDAEFLDSSPILLLGENPLAVDRVAGSYITHSRKLHGMKKRNLENALIFQYAEELGLEAVSSPTIFDIPYVK
tara:strand:- start:45 stop:1139 length:1095 start_codon:yes stop_codon:yes gene_type:complete